MGGAEVLEALYPLLLKHGKPEFIRSDNGPEFISEHFQRWLTKVGVKPIRIRPLACARWCQKLYQKMAHNEGALHLYRYPPNRLYGFFAIG